MKLLIKLEIFFSFIKRLNLTNLLLLIEKMNRLLRAFKGRLPKSDSPLRNTICMVHKSIKVRTEKIYLLKVKVALLTICSLSFFEYFNRNYYKKLKGLRKLARIYRPEESKHEMIMNDTSLLQLILEFDRNYPMAILFPNRLESLQKVLLLANKYKIAVRNSNESSISAIHRSSKPFIIVNQKNMLLYELNP